MDINIISPQTSDELLTAIGENQGNKFRFGAGYSDLLLELKRQSDPGLTIINLDKLEDDRFSSIQNDEDEVRIGALVSAHRIASDSGLRDYYPVLCESALKHGSRQIRQVATIGGNLCTASPAGDMACALVALQAKCDILTDDGSSRVVPIDEFFTGVRTTCLRSNEILRSVIIERLIDYKKMRSDFLKVGTRRSMECSIISLAYHILTDNEDKIIHAGIAIGSAAPTIKYCESAGEYIAGKVFTQISPSESGIFANKVVEYASPISDIRASDWYRKEVLANIANSIFD